MTDGSRIVALDHELAFSFLQAVLSPVDAWTLADSAFLREHVFHDQLKSVLLSTDRIREAITALTPETLDSIEAAIPKEWLGPHIASIRDRIEGIVEHVDDFISAVNEILR